MATMRILHKDGKYKPQKKDWLDRQWYDVCSTTVGYKWTGKRIIDSPWFDSLTDAQEVARGFLKRADQGNVPIVNWEPDFIEKGISSLNDGFKNIKDKVKTKGFSEKTSESSVSKPVEFRFDSRSSGQGIIFVGDATEKRLSNLNDLKAGSRVTLHRGPVTIMVDLQVVGTDGELIGNVVGFENWNEYEFYGLTPGTIVHFSSDQVFGSEGA